MSFKKNKNHQKCLIKERALLSKYVAFFMKPLYYNSYFYTARSRLWESSSVYQFSAKSNTEKGASEMLHFHRSTKENHNLLLSELCELQQKKSGDTKFKTLFLVHPLKFSSNKNIAVAPTRPFHLSHSLFMLLLSK